MAYTKHGESIVGHVTSEYRAWDSMKQRCYNPRNISFKNYGDRGIKVCERWVNNFENFLSDMGNRPEGYTLGRKDNDGDYSPENCEWQTYTKQNRTRGNNKLTLAKVREIRMQRRRGYTLKELAKEFGVTFQTISEVINYDIWRDDE